ncbi:hypothetical protein pb186bvf_000527 [Paramecium bursaria]
MSLVTIKIWYANKLFCKYQIPTSSNFLELADTMLTLHHFKEQPPKAFAFVLKDFLIQGDDLKKEFCLYSNTSQQLSFIVDQEILEYNNSDIQKNAQINPQSQNNKCISEPDFKIEIIIYRTKVSVSLGLSEDWQNVSFTDIYDYLSDIEKMQKIKNVAFLHQLSATLYEFEDFKLNLIDIPNFEREKTLIFLDNDDIEKFRPKKIIKQTQNIDGVIQPLKSLDLKKNQIKNGITINILSQEGQLRQIVNLDPNLSVFDLKQLVFQYLGYKNPSTLDVDLFKSNGFQLNSANKQNKSLFDLNIASKETIIAQIRQLMDQKVDQSKSQQLQVDKKNQPQQELKQIQPQGRITIDIISEDGPQKRSFKMVNLSSSLLIFELEQLVRQHLGHTNPEIVDVLLYKSGSHLNKSQDKIETLLDNESGTITLIAKNRWIGGRAQLKFM